MELLMLTLVSLLLGFTMKTADLLDEHGLRWFKFSDILFGFLWGILGAVILNFDEGVRMFWLATFLTYIVKAQIDYINHGIAETIILLVFLANVQNWGVNWEYFYYFFALTALAGLFNKYYVEKGHLKNKFLKSCFKWRVHYASIALIFSILTGYWTVFLTRIVFWIAYELTDEYGQRIAAKQKIKSA